MHIATRLSRRIATSILFSSFVFAGSVHAADSKEIAPGFAGISANDTVAVMPVDVELFELSAGGVAEPKADWTAAAHKHLMDAFGAQIQGLKLKSVSVSEKEADDFADQVGLHAALAKSMELHHAIGGAWSLPTKAGKLSWSFGDVMRPIADKTGARYGLFLRVRDSYASGSRQAMMIGMALLGVSMGGGVQVGYASLVDLQTGQVIWFNRLARGSGDLRTLEPAKDTVKLLMNNFPAVR